MKVFVVLVIVVFTVCSAGAGHQHRHYGGHDDHQDQHGHHDHHGDHGSRRHGYHRDRYWHYGHGHSHHDDDHKDDDYYYLYKTFLKYIAKETDHDHTADLKRCHLSDKIHDIFSKSKNTINKVLIFFYSSVAAVIQEFVFKIQYRIDHVVVHVKSYLKNLRINHYYISKELEDKFQYKLDDLKKDSEHYSRDLNYKGLRVKLEKTLDELKGYAKKDVMYSHSYHYKDDKKDLKKEFEDYLDYCKKHLLDVTKHYEGTVDSKIYRLFHKDDKDDDKKGKSVFRRRFSCRAVKGRLDYMWDKFCKHSH